MGLFLFDKRLAERGAADQRIHVRNGALNTVDVHANTLQHGCFERKAVGPSTAGFKAHEHGFLEVVVDQADQGKDGKQTEENASVLGEGQRESEEHHQAGKHQRPKRLFVATNERANVRQRC